MKRILILCVATLLAGFGYMAWRWAQPVHYGHAFSGQPAVALRQLSQKDVFPVGHDVRVEGKIIRQCPMTGCWFYLDDGKGNQLRVELGKVTPQLPKRLGWHALVEGKIVQGSNEPVFVGNGVEFWR